MNGFYGEWLAKFDIKVTYTWLGIAVAMAFTSIPFVVRTDVYKRQGQGDTVNQRFANAKQTGNNRPADLTA